MPNDSTKKELSERAQHLLKVLVRRYVEDGQPLGSKSLVQAADLDISPATARNVLADLESMGYIQSPHTSSGRIPTARGYRFFVDSLVTFQKPKPSLLQEFESQLGINQNTKSMVASASEYLSGITKLAGIVTLPRLQRMALKQLEFLPLSDNRVLAVIVTHEHSIQNRVIQLHRTFNSDELREISNYLNSQFAGKDIAKVRADLIRELGEARESMNQMMRNAVNMADQLFQDQPDDDDYHLAGEVNLMSFDELSNIEKLRQLFEAFNQKREIIHVLDQCLGGQGVQIFIGEESGYKSLGDCSVVTAPYCGEGQVLGVLGVIGPTRMPYDRVIPLVDITAKLLGAALNSKS